MLDDVEHFLIDDAWKSVHSNKCLECDLDDLSSNQLKFLEKLIELFSLLTECRDKDHAQKLIQQCDLGQEVKSYISNLHKQECERRKIEWCVDIIIGNSLCCKSLHPKIKLRIGEHIVEMNIAKFATLRYEVAHALRRMDAYT